MQKQIKMIPANKNSRFQIKDNEGEFYHVLFVDEIPTADNAKVIEHERIAIYSPKGFKQYLNHKKHFSWKHEEIIHDPTLMAKEEQPMQQESDQPEAPVKKVNAGLAAFHAKQKELKQSKTENQ